MNLTLERIAPYEWMLPRTGAMRVPGVIFADEALIEAVKADQSLVQLANVATLPGIVGRALAMPDIHWGYGFPIGGVSAFDAREGVVSPGGVGYDINCGCRLMTTRLMAEDIRPRMADLVAALFRDIPTGVGSTGGIKLKKAELARVATQGAAWAVRQGMGGEADLEHTEDNGQMPGADPAVISERALTRGHDQLGTLGSGNHFLEIQAVDEIYDGPTAQAFGLFPGQVTVLIHTGSRGFGHQICDDFLKEMLRVVTRDHIQLPDRQLACAPLASEVGRRYLAAMACAANFAWANRQILMHLVGETLLRTLGLRPAELGLRLLYDVCHNIAKMETHLVEGRWQEVCVHRKGATRALPPGHPLVPPAYRQVGQPVLIPGDMGTHSYVLTGAENALHKSFGSSCHGAGRVLSRKEATRRAQHRSIRQEMAKRGIVVQARGHRTLMEEMPEAYKDISQVVHVVDAVGLARKVARLRPLGVIKG